MCFIYLRPYQNDPTLPEREQKQNLRSVAIILIAIAANTTMRCEQCDMVTQSCFCIRE